MDRALSATVSRFATTVSIVLLATACGESRRLPTAPLSAPLRPPPPQPPFPVPPDDRTITGSVLGYSSHGVEPLAGIDVWRWIESEAFGYTRGAVRTDAAGRFSFEAPSGVLVRLFASSGEFSQPCLATVGAAQGEATVRLVAGADRTRASDLTGLILGPTLTGTVFESTAAGPLPIADAWVEVDGAGGNGLLLASRARLATAAISSAVSKAIGRRCSSCPRKAIKSSMPALRSAARACSISSCIADPEALALLAALDLLIKPVGQVDFRSLQPVHLILLHREPDVEALLLHLVGLPLHGCHPAAIQIADVHEDAHGLEHGHLADIGAVQQSWIAGQRADVLGVRAAT